MQLHIPTTSGPIASSLGRESRGTLRGCYNCKESGTGVLLEETSKSLKETPVTTTTNHREENEATWEEAKEFSVGGFLNFTLRTRNNAEDQPPENGGFCLLLSRQKQNLIHCPLFIYEIAAPVIEPLPRALPKNQDPRFVSRNKRMLGQLAGE
ncbi:hypothetical protein SADUNF_Sadunf03G0014100 [Salix dunnii]|uniref:Uncharacterized protein n=1 Tax=Salix dunnii TaxID=1413687 RepID=A0A835KFK0_9ROSI|nr:hypothetical protein SADUNF_Sadunf03G0014100 [Salix dunnii]